ncbi:MAG: hypothetical protein JWM96_762 [Alphaproteobacteria bacterium]|nr:hypothetical protein [Alphaproteobacteria bacterium]
MQWTAPNKAFQNYKKGALETVRLFSLNLYPCVIRYRFFIYFFLDLILV